MKNYLDVTKLRYPKRLCRNDTIGIISPSEFPVFKFPDRYNMGIEALKKYLGLNPVTGECLFQQKPYSKINLETKSRELEGFIVDHQVKAIFCAIGGFQSARILPYLNQRIIKENPKIVVGYSDCCALLLGLQAIGNWITFHGPMIMTQLGEYPRPFEYTLKSLKQVLFGNEASYQLEDPAGWTNEFLDWGDGSWLKRKRRMNTPANREIWKPGYGKGRLFGGNIETVNLLAGTPYFVFPEKSILFWEATGEEAHLPRICRALTHFKQIGLFENVQAMLIGRIPDCKPTDDRTLKGIVLDMTAEYGFPIISELAIGHTDPLATLPIGVCAEVKANEDVAEITVLESAIS